MPLEQANPESSRGLGRILIVEDQRVVARHLSAKLVAFGYTVDATGSGEQAVAKALSLVPDLVLMDIHLPGAIDGIQAATLIKRSADIPVIFMSALSDERTQRRAGRTEPDAFLVKPFAPDELRCAIELALHKREIGESLKKREGWLATTLRSIGATLSAPGTVEKVAPRNPVAEALRGWPPETTVDKTIDQILQLVADASESRGDVSALVPLPANTSIRLAAKPPQVSSGVDAQNLAAEVRELNWNLERRVLERTEQLEAANRELDAFNSSVAHDLRAPLRGIDGFSQALIEGHASHLGPEGVDKLQRIRLATRRMAALIDGLLRLSRVARSEIRKLPVDLSAMAMAIATELQAAHPERRVDSVVADGMTALGDEQLLRILLQNLLENAWKFSSKVAAARIECGQVSKDGVHIYFVRDNGAGFDMDRSQKLFGAFQRMHSEQEFEGTGVGLAIAQRIIDRHGGLIWAESAVGAGTTFHFTL